MVQDQKKGDVAHFSLLIATPDHAAIIAALHAQSFEQAWSESEICQLLEADTAVSFLATVDQGRAPAGFVIGRLAGDDAEIVTVGVLPSARRRGIASALVQGFCRAGRLAGGERAVFEVAVDNEAALKLYQRLGFNEAGRRAGYYDRPGGDAIDALILTRKLDSWPST